MRRRTVLMLGGAAAVVVGAAVLLAPEDVERLPPGQAVLAFPGLAQRLQNAARIEVQRHDGTLTLVRQGEAWVLPDKGGYPVRPERVRELLTGLTELRLTEPRTADPEMLGRLGLEDPASAGATSSLLRVVDASGAPVAELVIGRRRVRTQGNVPESVYVRRPAETQSWLAEGRLPVDADPQLWLDRDIANLPRDRVGRVTVRRVDEPELVLTRAGDPEGQLSITTPEGAPPAEEASLDEVGRAFEFLTFLDVRPQAETPGTELGSARFELSDGLILTAYPNREGEQLWLRLSAEGGEEAERMNARWRGWAYQVGQWKEKAFLPRLADLRREEAAPAAAQEAPATLLPAEQEPPSAASRP